MIVAWFAVPSRVETSIAVSQDPVSAANPH